MKACIPAPGGALLSSPKARMAHERMAVATNSLKKDVAMLANGAGWVKSAFEVPPSRRDTAAVLPPSAAIVPPVESKEAMASR